MRVRTCRAGLVTLVALLPHAAWAQTEAGLHPHASTESVRFQHSTEGYSLDHPKDWKAHETAGRVTVGADDGLVPTERGFRTIYGAIVAIVDDAEAGGAARSIETSARAVVDTIVKRNAHQSISEPVRLDRSLAGAPAARAVLNGISPVTRRGERAEIICRAYGASQVLYVILVSPTDASPEIQSALQRLRDSIRVSGNR